MKWVYGDPNPSSWHETAKILKTHQPKPKSPDKLDKISKFLETLKNKK